MIGFSSTPAKLEDARLVLIKQLIVFKDAVKGAGLRLVLVLAMLVFFYKECAKEIELLQSAKR